MHNLVCVPFSRRNGLASSILLLKLGLGEFLENMIFGGIYRRIVLEVRRRRRLLNFLTEPSFLSFIYVSPFSIVYKPLDVIFLTASKIIKVHRLFSRHTFSEQRLYMKSLNQHILFHFVICVLYQDNFLIKPLNVGSKWCVPLLPNSLRFSTISNWLLDKG